MHVVRRIIDIIVEIVFSILCLIKLKYKDKNTLYVLMAPHIGDVCYSMSFLKRFREYNHHSDITVIARKQLDDLYQLYEGGYDKRIYMSEKKIIRFISGMRWMNKLHRWRIPHIIDTYPVPEDMRLCQFEQVNAVNMTKQIIYGLPAGTRPQRPNFSSVNSDAFSKYMLNERRIILSPYAQTVPEIKMEFWEKLTAILVKKGYSVYTNVANNQTAIKGSVPLECTLKEIIAFADAADYFIGTRSGVFDLIVSCQCKIVVLYAEYKYAQFYSLKAWNMNENILEVCGVPALSEILSFVDKN